MDESERMTENSEKRECKRCTRPFTPVKSDQEYGEKCLRILAGQKMLPDGYVIPPRKKRKKKATGLEIVESVTKIALAAVFV
jgi:hypothetical protein